MTIGQWLGKIAGNWLGATGEVDPNAMVGSASFSITANATLTAVIVEQNVIAGGGIRDGNDQRFFVEVIPGARIEQIRSD